MAKRKRILVVEDDEAMLEFLVDLLVGQGFHVDAAKTGLVAKVQIKEHRYDVVVSDLILPEADGMEILSFCKAAQPECIFILITACTEVEKAVQAMKHGADDFFQKPFHVDELLNVVQSALKRKESLKIDYDWPDYFGLIGKSESMRKTFDMIERVATSESTVLITGESGTGKELAARAVHGKSDRLNGPFMVIHCGAMPEGVLESEIFGHERGAFTSAVAQKDGIFKVADGGAVFLDEIGDTSFSLQVKLLRVIETGTFRPVGSTRDIHVDARVIAATNADLEAEVRDKRFRLDLYYRLNVFPLIMPPLRDRDGDIELLANCFVKRFRDPTGSPMSLHPKTVDMLSCYSWPGNVRQLENTIERAAIMATSSQIMPCDLSPEVCNSTAPDAELGSMFDCTFNKAKLMFEKRFAERQLDRAHGNVSVAAQRAQMSRAYLYELIKKHDVQIR